MIQFFLICRNVEVKLVNIVIGLIENYMKLKENIDFSISNASEFFPQVIKFNKTFTLDDY